MIKLLDLPDPDVKKNAAIAISSLLEDCKAGPLCIMLTFDVAVGIRSEIRYANGLRPILDLLTNEHPEVQENGLKCFIKSSEDG